MILLLSLSVLAQEDPDAEIVAGKRPLPGLTLELLVEKTSHEQGEPIEVTMKYSYSGDRKLAILDVTGDRSGRITDFGFTAKNAKGAAVRDPLEGRLTGFGGGPRSSEPLGKGEPFEQKVVLNEWLCFDAPGTYTVRARSAIVSLDSHGTGNYFDGAPIPLTSAPLTLVIVAADDARRKGRLARAAKAIASDDDETREAAARDLRFMMDDRAIPLLVKHLADPSGNVALEATFGLYSIADMEPVRKEILARAKERALSPRERSTCARVLAEADRRQKTDGGEAEYDWGAFRAWEKRLKKLGAPRRADLTPAEAAAAVVEEMVTGGKPGEEEWRLVLENLDDLGNTHLGQASYWIENGCRHESLIPLLKAIAESHEQGCLRSAAIIALHEMGEDSFRDRVLADLTSPDPVFHRRAHATLGDHRAGEVGEKLIGLLDHDTTVRNLARRIRDFGGTIPAERLAEAVRVHGGRLGRLGKFPLIEALALRSPATAMAFLEEIVEDPRTARNPRDAIRLLVRLDRPDAQELLLDLFQSPEPETRAILAQALRAAHESTLPHRTEPFGRRLRAAAPTAALFPEILALYLADPAGTVRVSALMALDSISEQPQDEGPMTLAAERAHIPRWRAWWRENGARFGRWGKVRLGLAVRCAADRGIYEVGQKIRLTVRVHRVSAGNPLERFLVVSGSRDGDDRLEEQRIPIPEGWPGAKPGGDATQEIEIKRAGGIGEPGLYRLYVRCIARGASHLVAEAAPIEFRIR
jgi:HEAT repeat protein